MTNSNGMNPESIKIPKCIGLIMDGNRRFAKAHGLDLFEGHRLGYEKLKDVCKWSIDAQVSHLIAYAFSTENWNRTAEEVSYLMDLIRDVLSKEMKVMRERGVRVRCIGDFNRFPPDIRELIEDAERDTADGTALTLVLAISYGGRSEILSAINSIVAHGDTDITEEKFEKYLWTTGIPDPDLIIRTSGEERLSGFLPWQGVYSEIFFTKTHWPALDRTEFQDILESYTHRSRRYGK